MSIKVAMLQSGEDVISDIKEIVFEEKVIGYQFDRPYIVKLSEPEILVENERKSISVLFYPWAPLSSDKQFFVPKEWVVTVYNTHSEIINSYLEKIDGRRNDRHDGTVGRESIESNQMYLAEESLLVDNGD